MRTNSLLFWIIGAFFWASSIGYTIWSLAVNGRIEWVGTPALALTGVLGVFLVGRIPLWVIVVVVLRDAYLLIGGAWLLSRYRIRVPVVYPGKFATTFLFIGFAGLLLNAPLIPGLGWCDISWLPGFNGEAVSWGIWFIYAGLILSLGVTIYYTVAAARALAAELRHRKEAASESSSAHGDA